jgi:ubiquinone/menaquinone biosynthesis C-methylase UbiE
MHTKSVIYHDLLYRFQDFKTEANLIDLAIQENFPGAKTILDVACGPHEHVITLKEKYQVDGIDINEEFLPIARMKNPNGYYAKANMCNFDLGKLYDVILCLSSSIGYVKNLCELNDTLKCFVRHLNPCGMVMVVPWFSPETWSPGKVSIVVGEEDNLKVARASVRTNNGNESRMHFTYMVASPNGVETFTEDHYLQLFTQNEMYEAFSLAGLKVKQSEGWSPGRGLLIGILI